jgi:hypothetical protein
MDGVSKETKKWANQLLHPNKEKHGRVPRPAGEKVEEKIPRAEPSHGISDRGKSNEHGRKYNPYHHGKKLTGDQHE